MQAHPAVMLTIGIVSTIVVLAYLFARRNFLDRMGFFRSRRYAELLQTGTRTPKHVEDLVVYAVERGVRDPMALRVLLDTFIRIGNRDYKKLVDDALKEKAAAAASEY